MTVDVLSGASTPFSSTSTLTAPPSPQSKSFPISGLGNVFKKPLIPASSIVEFISSRSTTSSTVYVYDLAEQAGFGTFTKSWSECEGDSTASVVSLQTRAGAGLSIVGRLSGGTSRDAARGAILTAYTTPTGISAMAQSLTYLPPATPTSRLVIQAPTVTPVGETFSLSPTLAPLSSALAILPEDIVILLSATPQETADLTTISYKLTHSHVIHLFNHHSSSREVGHVISPPVPTKEETAYTVPSVIKQSGYNFFDYTGDASADTVIVLLNSPLALAAKALAAHTPGLGVIIVRVLRPWDESGFLEVLPPNVKTVHVLDDVPNEATQGHLYIDVFSALLESPLSKRSVRGHRIVPARTHEYTTEPSSFRRFLLSLVPDSLVTPPSTDQLKKLLFFSTPKSPLSVVPRLVETTFLSNASISARSLTDHDVFSKAGGITADRILLSPLTDITDDLPIPLSLPIASRSQGESDFLGILDHTLLKSHYIVNYAKPSSTVLIVTPWSSAELLSNLPTDVRSLIYERNLRICIIDPKGLASKIAGASGPENDTVQKIITHLVVLRLYLGNAATEELVHKVAHFALGEQVKGIKLADVNAHAWTGVTEVQFPAEAVDALPAVLKEFEFNAIAVETDEGDTVVNGVQLGSWHDAAKHLLFPSVFTPEVDTSSETYPQNPALRPEIADRTFLITCAVNRRLTPLEYDRNVFHLEFDTAGTGLKYAIGEALGIHGWNDEQEVNDFCAWYGVDPTRLITIPILGGEGKMHTRTVFQALQQQIDLFGHPPKSFYAELAPYATNSVDKHALLFIGSAEGSSTYKKLSEKDTVTFADVLMLYPSARPGIEVLCEMMGDIKPRHYSIASAQSVVGDRIDLLVVTVEWTTPSGSPRYGQCTRYLAGLKVGQKVTVSIKPSVMKLPPSDSQPIILAGLGTGAAPFRAFLQHRAWLAAQNIPVGPTYYYFGSRHQSQEYLYGEEIEAFILDGTITRAGLAFSRDGPKKVYIQHKMLEDAERLVGMLRDEEGVFYLCGPTWPVPDVYEALVDALVKYKGEDRESAGTFLEGLKEEERYVLEVY